MGKGYRNIILVTDGTKASQAAAQTVLNLAKKHSAKVLVIDTVRPPSFAASWLNSNSEELFDIVVADKRERLEKVAGVLQEAGIEASVEILFGKSSEEIAKAALTEPADLVVRYMKGPQSRHASPFGTTARNLMRVCPCPLLLVADKPVSDPKVIACVNPEHDFKENESIVVEAENLAGKHDDLMALYCWKFYGREYLREYMDEKTVKSYMDQAEQNYRGLYDQFLEKHDMNAFGKGVHLQNGDPIQVIPEVCRHESVDVAVMSSASSNHPLNRLLGSTVESVLEDLPCALLVVKPLGFKSPIKPGRSKVELDSV
jgi:universal stress protein E